MLHFIISVPGWTNRCPSKPGAAQGLHSRPVPAHLLRLVHALGHDLVDRTLHESGRDRLPASTSGRVGDESILVALEVAQQLGDVPLEAADAGQIKHLPGHCQLRTLWPERSGWAKMAR